MSIYKADQLTFAEASRCSCGAGLAYAPGDDCWDCSAILMGTADKGVTHTDRLPFRFWKVGTELQPLIPGRTTRPKAADHAD